MFEKEPDLLTRRQCQELLHISKSTMLKFIREGLIPARKIAGAFRVCFSIQDWLRWECWVLMMVSGLDFC